MPRNCRTSPTRYKMKMKSYGQGKSPVKGLLGKILNPAQMLPGKMGEIAGKINPLGKL